MPDFDLGGTVLKHMCRVLAHPIAQDWDLWRLTVKGEETANPAFSWKMAVKQTACVRTVGSV